LRERELPPIAQQQYAGVISCSSASETVALSSSYSLCSQPYKEGGEGDADFALNPRQWEYKGEGEEMQKSFLCRRMQWTSSGFNRESGFLNEEESLNRERKPNSHPKHMDIYFAERREVLPRSPAILILLPLLLYLPVDKRQSLSIERLRE
jgi:hypothetical protein